MRSPVRMLALSVGVLALAATGCATVPEGSIEAAAVECPPDSDCYDVPRAVGDGGEFIIEGGEFFFNPPEGLFWSGDIEVTLINVGAAEHNIVFIGANEGSEIPFAPGGETDTQVVNLFEGNVIYYCSIPGHRAQGMEGTVTIHPTREAAEDAMGAPEPDADATEDTDATEEPDDTATEEPTEDA
jgi:plastocyanin